jgi:hypothetical protein
MEMMGMMEMGVLTSHRAGTRGGQHRHGQVGVAAKVKLDRRLKPGRWSSGQRQDNRR